MERDHLHTFYVKFSREIYLYLLGMCKDSYLAEDLTQETFVKALLSLKDDHVNVRAWLFKVARNLYFNEYKNKKRLTENLSGTKSMLSADESILNHLIQNESIQRLHQLIRTLDERSREVLLLQYFSRMSQKEIAGIMGISHQNVRVLSFRAKREIKEKWEEMER